MKKQEIVKALKNEHNTIVKQKSNNECFQQVGMSFQLTLLERTFLDVYSSKMNISQTKCITKFIRALMKRHPDIVSEAKSQIETK